MNIVNKTSFPVIALCWHKQYGYGYEVTIDPGQSKEVSGPYIGEMGEGSCRLAMPGEITCHEDEDGESGFYVSDGNQLSLGNGESGITIRHHENELILG